MSVMKKATDILGIVSSRKAAGEPFVLATVVRTVAATAAKAGAKAVILPDGTISEGWIGGGCARAAVLKAANDALSHVQAAQGYLAEADGIPFQFHHPAFIATDQPALRHLEKSLQTATRLSHGATLQLTLAQHMLKDWQSVTGQLNASLAARNWAQVAGLAGDLQRDLKSQTSAVQNPEAFLDPLWGKWTDAMTTYATTAQAYSLAAAGGQTQTAQQLGRVLAAESDQMSASLAAARANTGAWQQKTIQPLLDTVSKELAAGS